MKLNRQKGHFDFTALYWAAVVLGLIASGGGVWLLVFGVKGLL